MDAFGGRTTGQALGKSVQILQRGLMSEPLAKVARMMPEVGEKNIEVPSLENDAVNGVVNGVGNGEVSNMNGHAKMNGVTNGHANGTTEEDEEAGDGSELLIKRLSEDAKIPHRGSLHAAGIVCIGPIFVWATFNT